jgi:hypothetical protein
MLEVFKVDVLEILRWLALYSMNDTLETSKRTKKTEQQSEDNQQYDAMAR